MIDSTLQSELRARFNPDGSLLRRHQLRMLEMLKYIDKVCQENDIPYWLSSGTCLGAVRHGGFIPWDDDVDIEMLRDDYLKLEKILESRNEYYLQTYNSDQYYMAPYAKLRDKNSVISEHNQDRCYKFTGVYIDIFQLEALPRWLAFIAGGVNRRILLLGSNSDKWTSFLFFFLKRIFYGTVPIMRGICQSLCNPNILRHTFGSGFSKKYRKKEWLKPVKKAIFEDTSFPIPNNVDAYLRSLYGNDYMQLPDLEKIHSHITGIEIF